MNDSLELISVSIPFQVSIEDHEKEVTNMNIFLMHFPSHFIVNSSGIDEAKLLIVRFHDGVTI